MGASEGAAARLIAQALVWDNHACMPLRPLDESFLAQLARHRRAGFDVVVLNIGFGEQGIEEHIRMLALFRRWLKARPDEYLVVRTVADIRRARATGLLGVAFDIEGANAISDQISLVQLYYDLGVRWMLMAYNRNNRVGGGCHDDDTGLTDFGRALIDEMGRVGMVACCSHTGERTAFEVMDYSRKPVIFSHSNPLALHNHPRNISDRLMRACAATDGVVGLNGIGTFLGENDNSTANYVRHLDHVVQLVGPRHAAIGLDFVFDQAELDDYVSSMEHTFPAGMGYGAGVRFVAPEQLEPIVDSLIGLGYRDDDIRGILGENLMRVAGAVWQAPQQGEV